MRIKKINRKYILACKTQCNSQYKCNIFVEDIHIHYTCIQQIYTSVICTTTTICLDYFMYICICIPFKIITHCAI